VCYTVKNHTVLFDNPSNVDNGVLWDEPLHNAQMAEFHLALNEQHNNITARMDVVTSDKLMTAASKDAQRP
jgi:hypothetical protein